VKESEREREREILSFLACFFIILKPFRSLHFALIRGCCFADPLFFSFIESRKIERSCLLATTTTASDEFCEKIFVKDDAGKKKKNNNNQSFRAFSRSHV
jgi:hypothetical protein